MCLSTAVLPALGLELFGDRSFILILILFQIVALPLFFAAVSAGLIGSPIAYGASPYAYGASPYAAVAHAPIAYSAPAVIKTAAYAAPATSYSNTYRVSFNQFKCTSDIVASLP